MPLKLKFQASETKVSSRWNFSFSLMKLWYQGAETDLLRRKRLRDATVTAKLLSLCYHTLPSPHNNHIIIYLPPFM